MYFRVVLCMKNTQSSIVPDSPCLVPASLLASGSKSDRLLQLRMNNRAWNYQGCAKYAQTSALSVRF